MYNIDSNRRLKKNVELKSHPLLYIAMDLSSTRILILCSDNYLLQLIGLMPSLMSIDLIFTLVGTTIIIFIDQKLNIINGKKSFRVYI